MKTQGHIPDKSPAVVHERTEIDVGRVTRIGLVMALILVLSLLAVGALFHAFDRAHPGRGSEAAPRVFEAQLPPQPRIQVHPGRDLRQVRALEDEHLNHYAWIDRSRGIARVPIDRAMVLWLQSNAGAVTNVPTSTTNLSPAGATELQMRQQKAEGSVHVP